ncbi:MAG: lipid-binding SYLF domain-containing protein [Pseudomonadota bacterium]
MTTASVVIGMVLAAMVMPVGSYAAEPPPDPDRRIAEADRVLTESISMPDGGLPTDLVRRCRGIAIFPGFIKAGVVVGVSFGNGVLVRKDEKTGRWSKPAFFAIRGGSIGLQAGAQSVDLVLLFMTEEAIERMLEDQYRLGADLAVAAGPVGRDASAGTDSRFMSGVLSYSRAKGLFAGVSLEGAVIEPDRDANFVYHGKGVTAQDVFYEGGGRLTEASRRLLDSLEKISGPRTEGATTAP